MRVSRNFLDYGDSKSGYDVRKPFRLGIVGTGRIAAVEHLPAAIASIGVQVAALVDPVVERAHQLAQKFGINPKVAGNVGEIFGEIDGAIIATPNHTHCELALECLQAGVPCLIEKPLAVSVGEGEAIVHANEKHRLTVAVGYYTRFAENVRLMRTLLKDGYFGVVRRFAYQFGTAGGWAPLSAYNLDRRAAGGGVLMISGTHFLDRLLYWFGYPDDLDYQDDSLGGPEANALATFRYSSGLIPFEGTARFSKTVPLKEGGVIETDLGKVVFHGSSILFQPQNRPSIEIIIRRRGKELCPTRKGLFQLQLEDFVEACELKREPMIPARQGLESLRLIEALYSHRSPMETNWYGSFPKEVTQL